MTNAIVQGEAFDPSSVELKNGGEVRIIVLNTQHNSLNKHKHTRTLPLLPHSFCVFSLCRRLLSMRVTLSISCLLPTRGYKFVLNVVKRQDGSLAGARRGVVFPKIMIWTNSHTKVTRGGLKRNIEGAKRQEATCVVA